MFVHERQEQILSLLRQTGKVLVRDLSARFQVTEDCVRKDLAALEKNGSLKRVYGGAVLERVNTHQFYVSERKGKNLAAKRAIAEKAMTQINDGDLIFLDISTSNIALAELLASSARSFAVATNMIDVMQILSRQKNIDLTFIGGLLNRGRDGCAGALANSVIAQLRFDAAFLGVVGVDVRENAVLTYMQEDGFTKREILRSSRRAYLLAETEKFARSGNFRYAGLEAFHGAILESAPPEDLRKQLLDYRLEIL